MQIASRPVPALAALALLASFLSAGTGCATIPVPGGLAMERTSTIPDSVGDARSNKPIRPGSTRSLVHGYAGVEPDDVSADGSWEHFRYRESWGRVYHLILLAPCHGPRADWDPIVERHRHLVVTYDGDCVRDARILDEPAYAEERRRVLAAGTVLRQPNQWPPPADSSGVFRSPPTTCPAP